MMKFLSVRVPRDLDMRLGIEAIKQDTSKQALVIDALEQFLAARQGDAQEQTARRGE